MYLKQLKTVGLYVIFSSNTLGVIFDPQFKFLSLDLQPNSVVLKYSLRESDVTTVMFFP
jgi:hypothetical protein